MQTMFAVILQILQLGRRDFAIDLRQRLESAHRQQRVPERNDDDHERNLRPESSLEPAPAIRWSG